MKNSGGFFGGFWFAGWLFTISYANLVWWKIILGIVVWPSRSDKSGSFGGASPYPVKQHRGA